MALQVSAEEIVFVVTGTGATSHANLNLTNSTNSLVAYKVKTTAPNNYFVKPKAGVLAPGASQDVQITLQAQFPTDSNISQDRFQVLSAPCETSDGLSRDEWLKLDKSVLQEKRLAVAIKTQATTKSSVSGSDNIPLPDLKAKYDELANYTITLEKTKGNLEEELRRRKSVGTPIQTVKGYSFIQLVIAIIVAVLVARVAVNFGY
jgi:vesicle-associated membrane protein-associated protein B